MTAPDNYPDRDTILKQIDRFLARSRNDPNMGMVFLF